MHVQNNQQLTRTQQGIQWLAIIITTVDQSIARPANWGSVVEQAADVEGKLGGLEKALEHEGTEVVAEILKGEILPAFEVFGREMTVAIDCEGERQVELMVGNAWGGLGVFYLYFYNENELTTLL